MSYMDADDQLTLIVRAKPFRAYPRGSYKFHVSEDGRVWVWDAIAGHFTTIHSLSAADTRRIRQIRESA